MSIKQVQPGKILTVTAGGAVTSGSVQEVGSDFIGVALDAASGLGVDYPLALEGVFTVAKKTSETWAVGDKVYWDSGNSWASKTYVAAAADAFLGVATAVVGLSATTGNVKLRGGAEAEVDLDDVVTKSLFDANTILYATTDNTPVALTVSASTIVGRKATGDIVALTAAETRTIAGTPLANSAGTTAPTANEDSGDGYDEGSVWIDGTADKAYVCLDATSTAAVWRQVGRILAIVQVDVPNASTSGTVSSMGAYNGKACVASPVAASTNGVVPTSVVIAAGTLTLTCADPGASGAKFIVLITDTDVG